MVMIQNALALIVYSSIYAFLHFKANYFLKSCLHTTLKASISNPFLKLTAIFATFTQSVIHLNLLTLIQQNCRGNADKS